MAVSWLAGCLGHCLGQDDGILGGGALADHEADLGWVDRSAHVESPRCCEGEGLGELAHRGGDDTWIRDVLTEEEQGCCYARRVQFRSTLHGVGWLSAADEPARQALQSRLVLHQSGYPSGASQADHRLLPQPHTRRIR